MTWGPILMRLEAMFLLHIKLKNDLGPVGLCSMSTLALMDSILFELSV